MKVFHISQVLAALKNNQDELLPVRFISWDKAMCFMLTLYDQNLNKVLYSTLSPISTSVLSIEEIKSMHLQFQLKTYP